MGWGSERLHTHVVGDGSVGYISGRVWALNQKTRKICMTVLHRSPWWCAGQLDERKPSADKTIITIMSSGHTRTAMSPGHGRDVSARHFLDHNFMLPRRALHCMVTNWIQA